MSYFCSQSMLTDSPDPCSSSRQAIKKCSYCVSPCTQALVFFEVLERFLQPVLQAPFTDMMKHWYVFHKGRKKKSSVAQHLVPYPCRLALCHNIWSRDRHLSHTTLQAIPHCILCPFFCRKKEKNNNKKSIYGHLGETFHHASGDRSSTFP